MARPAGAPPLPALFAAIMCALLSLPACDAQPDEGEAYEEIQVTDSPITVLDDDLVHVADLRVDGSGHTWVLTRYEPLVRVYDTEGRQVAGFGQPGGGPAEYGVASALVEGELGMGVMDPQRQRVRYYAPDGGFIEERPVEGGPRFPQEIREVYFGDLGWTWEVPDGFLQDRYPPPPAGAPMQLQQAYDFWAAELILLPHDGSDPRTVVTFSDFSTFSPDDPPAPRPLSAGPLWDLCPDHEFVFHTGGAGEVVRVGLDGDVRSRHPVELPLEPPDRSLLVDWMVEVLSGVQGMPGDTPEALRERAEAVAEMAEPYLEPTVPPTRLRCDAAGRAWIQLFGMDHDRRGYARDWVVVDREGTLTARVTFPVGFHPMRFEAERIVGVVRDELDVETVGWVPALEAPGAGGG